MDLFVFDAYGNIREFKEDIKNLLSDGAAFMTYGCPDHKSNISACNRPFAKR